MLSKFRLTCRVTPSDRRPHARLAWTDQLQPETAEHPYLSLPPRDKRSTGTDHHKLGVREHPYLPLPPQDDRSSWTDHHQVEAPEHPYLPLPPPDQQNTWTVHQQPEAGEHPYLLLPPPDVGNAFVSVSSSSSSSSSSNSLPWSSSASALASESSSSWTSHPPSLSSVSKSSRSSESSVASPSSSFSQDSAWLHQSDTSSSLKPSACSSVSSSFASAFAEDSLWSVSTELCYSASSAWDLSSGSSSSSCFSPDSSLSIASFSGPFSPDSSASASSSLGSSSSSSSSPSSSSASPHACSEGQGVLERNVTPTSAAFSVTTNTVTTSRVARSPGKSSRKPVLGESSTTPTITTASAATATAVVFGSSQNVRAFPAGGAGSSSLCKGPRCRERSDDYGSAVFSCDDVKQSVQERFRHCGGLLPTPRRFDSLLCRLPQPPATAHGGSFAVHSPPPLPPPPPPLPPPPPSPRGCSCFDSDSDAQIDSMSSSDLEHCEDLQTFELAQNLADVVVEVHHRSQQHHHHNHGNHQHQQQQQHVPDGVVLPEAPPQVDDGVGSDPGERLPINGGGESHVMSLREFEQLPPSPEDSEGALFPAMWEDAGVAGGGGGNGGGGGFTIGGGGAFLQDDGNRPEGPWTTVLTGKNSVRIFNADDSAASAAGGDGGAGGNNHVGDENHDLPSLEQRNRLIEQTLAEIYESPFQQLIYANSQQPSPQAQKKNSYSKAGKSARFQLDNPTDKAHHHHHHHQQQQQQQQTRQRTLNSSQDGVDESNENDEEEEEFDDDYHENDEEESTRAREEEELVVKDAAGDTETDTHAPMKASIARAARRAVSGYRTCDDADSYVGTRAKPTLILARAPPSPCGILRRTNRKAVAKGTGIHFVQRNQ